jgi:hypothetical protein
MQARGTIGDGRLERPFQLIILDNDKPKVPGISKTIPFAHGDGFIKNLEAEEEEGAPAGLFDQSDNAIRNGLKP